MSGPRRGPPRHLSRAYRRLLPGDLGAEACEELERGYESMRDRRSRIVAWVWFFGHLFRPSTWALARALRRGRTPMRVDASLSSPPRRWWAVISPLDLKLGLRMLVKHPGLSLVGAFGMAVAIAMGALVGTVAEAAYTPLPFDEGDRVVAIEVWDQAVNNQERRILHDYETWRDQLESVEDLGAVLRLSRNLVFEDGSAEPVLVTEMSASGFRLSRVPALLGRPLLEEDEREGAPPVVVIGHDVWAARFGSDPGVLGRTLQFGDMRYTLVGVMPEGFGFPLNDRFWVPLIVDASEHEPREGPRLRVFGRLTPGSTLDGAQAELTAVGLLAAAAFPETHARLKPRVMPYTIQLYDDMTGFEIPLLGFLVVMLLTLVCVNVAVLVYARTMTRRAEIAVRSALGASRGRVVAQLFVEALVLSSVAALIGLWAAGFALRWADVLVEPIGGTPFWIDFGLSSRAVVFVLALTVFGAVVVGVVPGLKATGRGVQANLQRLAVGASSMRLGGKWTALIVTQVAFAVAVLPVSIVSGSQYVRRGLAESGFAAEDFLVTQVMSDRWSLAAAAGGALGPEFFSRYTDLAAELVRRLEAEPGVTAVTVSQSVPGGEPTARIEVEGAGMLLEGGIGQPSRWGDVDVDFFGVFDVPVLSGRGFNSGDQDSASATVIVNRTFVRDVLGDENAIGWRVRRIIGRGTGEQRSPVPEMEPWYEIVGVVEDFPPNAIAGASGTSRVYGALTPGETYAVSLALRIRGDTPDAFAGRLRELAASVDPNLRLDGTRPLDSALGGDQLAMRWSALGIGLAMLSVLLLTAAGVYALMSFTVAQRRKEIGIRVALGARHGRIIGTIFSRALGQLALGVGVGLVGATLLIAATGSDLTGLADGPTRGQQALILAAVFIFMMAIGLWAAIGPARDGFRVEPVEALRVDG